LLVAAFAFLFIGSLIIFHQEHVLGKHIKLNSHLFISPKSKDKQGLTVKLVKPIQKFQDNGGFTGIVLTDSYSVLQGNASDIKLNEISFIHHEDIILSNHSLRGPPTV